MRDDRTNMTDYWKKEAGSFDAFYSDGSRFSPKAFVSRFLNVRTEKLLGLADIDTQSRLLDVGCGSGVHTGIFAPLCEHIEGIDFSEQMVEAARHRMLESGAKNWNLQVGDAQDLPFEKESFDWVISMGLLDYVSSPGDVLRECWRVLRNPGFTVFTIPKTPSVFSVLRTGFGNLVKKKIFSLPPIIHAVSQEELNDLLRSAGFAVQSVIPIWSAMWIVKAAKTER